MITIKPFKAWRPQAEHMEEIACVPYDVIDTEEARELARGKPRSFLHVIRPEIDLDPDTDIHADEVYETGAENLKRFCSDGTFVQDSEPSVYLYRLTWEGRSQVGLFSCVSVNDYDQDRILKHELTRNDKEDDRTRHIMTQQAHAEPVILTYRGTGRIDTLVEKTLAETEPLYDFTASDGVRHTLWQAPAPEEFIAAFREDVDRLYVADGHHRCKSASRAAEEMRKQASEHTGEEEYDFFPAVVVPMDQMRILPYNRVVHQAEAGVFERLKQELDLKPVSNPSPARRGICCVYAEGAWHEMELPEKEGANPAEALDVARLQSFVLEPYFGIKNPRKDGNISFVGGIRGTSELERLVDSGKAALAFSMFPTTIEELMEVSDAGLLMPPKSTWFEPKLRSGLLVHTF